MKRDPKTILMYVFALSLSLLAREVQAQEEREIKIGPASPPVVEHAHNHNITVEALKQGNTQYMLPSNTEDAHSITISQKQVADILDGTTMIINSSKDEDSGKTKGHQHRVTITFKVEEPEDSGW